MTNRSLDPRVFQILFLLGLLGIGAVLRDFSLEPLQVALTFTSALLTQHYWLLRLDLKQAGYLSAVVTACGISLLVRADSYWLHPLVACIAISSKFMLRLNTQHVFNPANLAAILALAILPGGWISPGQWGQHLALAVLFVALGSVVTQRAQRFDSGWWFLLIFMGLYGLRALYLGQPLSVWLHQWQNGAMLLFAFFMISDPMTTPRTTGLRLLHIAAVALLAFAWQTVWFRPHGPIIALFLLAPLVPLLNRLKPGKAYHWRNPLPVAKAQQNFFAANHPNPDKSA